MSSRLKQLENDVQTRICIPCPAEKCNKTFKSNAHRNRHIQDWIARESKDGSHGHLLEEHRNAAKTLKLVLKNDHGADPDPVDFGREQRRTDGGNTGVPTFRSFTLPDPLGFLVPGNGDNFRLPTPDIEPVPRYFDDLVGGTCNTESLDDSMTIDLEPIDISGGEFERFLDEVIRNGIIDLSQDDLAE
ncbi:hypothetical protein F5Y04DRAFT_250977 [Hypomontagnella monticulosa]|nr:hypothetical protein F5Y04DRAFT_250977 [Hypomontagnella monticulosa]